MNNPDVDDALRTAKVHRGPIHSSVAGRTDHLPMKVASGSYVIPADIISAMGEGNSMAGFKVAQNIFAGKGPYGSGGEMPYGAKGLPYGVPAPHRAKGGRIPAPLTSGHLCPECHGTGADFEATKKMEGDGRSYIMCRNCHGNGLDPAAYFRWGPHPPLKGKAAGGAASEVPIVAAGGEYVVPPEDVARIGSGNIDEGHKILDAFVKGMRKKTIQTLKSLPGPKKD